MRTLAAALIAAALLTGCTDTDRVPTPTPQAAPTPPDEGS
jgi:hypothetical protein